MMHSLIPTIHAFNYFFDVLNNLYRMQALKEPVYTQKEAEMAGGMGNYVLQKPDTSFTDVDMTEHELSKEIKA